MIKQFNIWQIYCSLDTRCQRRRENVVVLYLGTAGFCRLTLEMRKKITMIIPKLQNKNRFGVLFLLWPIESVGQQNKYTLCPGPSQMNSLQLIHDCFCSIQSREAASNVCRLFLYSPESFLRPINCKMPPTLFFYCVSKTQI